MGKLVPSPTVTSRTAAVLTPTPGIDVRTREGGWASSRALTRLPGLGAVRGQRERAGQAGHDNVEGAGPRDHDGLLVQRFEDIVDQPVGHARGLGPDELDELAASGFTQCGRGSVALQQPGDGLAVQAGAQHAPQRRVELGSNPRIRSEVRVASAARSWSKPTRTASSAVIASVSSSAGCAAWCGPHPR